MVTSTKTSGTSPKQADVTPDTKSWLTREESARLLSVSTQTIKNYERRNLLRPQQVTRFINRRWQDVTVHDPQALASLRQVLKTKIKCDATTDTSSWLTRNQSIELLRVSTQTLKNYERQGKLHPLRARREDARGYNQDVVVYDPKELARLPKGAAPFSLRSAGETEARCFEMFEQGKSFREIVISLRETSEMIHGLHERWLDDGGSFIVISDAAKKTLEELLGPFADVTELVELITTKCRGKP